MSIWNKCKDKMPPLNEDVLILFKYKKDKLTHRNLYYGIARRYINKPFPSSKGWEDWSTFTEYQCYYEVVFWTPLLDKPIIEGSDSE